MTSAYVLDVQDQKNEAAAEELENLETLQASVRKHEQWCYDQAFKYRNVAKAAEDAICQLGLDQETFDNVQYVYDVSRATCQVWIDEAAKAQKKAEAIGTDIRSARFCIEARSVVVDFSDGQQDTYVQTYQKDDILLT
jgi:hypothetical protein